MYIYTERERERERERGMRVVLQFERTHSLSRKHVLGGWVLLGYDMGCCCVTLVQFRHEFSYLAAWGVALSLDRRTFQDEEEGASVRDEEVDSFTRPARLCSDDVIFPATFGTRGSPVSE